MVLLSFDEINHEVSKNVRPETVCDRLLFNRAIDPKIGLIEAGSLDPIPVKHLPKAMFVEAQGLDRVVSFQPGDVPLSGNGSGIARFFQLIGKTVEFFGVQVVIVFPISQDMLETNETRVGARQQFCPEGVQAGLAKQ